MYEPHLESINLLRKQNRKQQQFRQVLKQAESKTEENEALLLLIDTIAHKLDSPMNAVMDCSEFCCPELIPVVPWPAI